MAYMKKKHYDFDRELQAYARLRLPIVPALIPLLNKVMGVLYAKERSTGRMAVSRLRVPARDGTELRVLEYIPTAASGGGPCILFFHGGGFVYQAAPHHFLLTRRLATALGCRAFFVDYRLAPKFPFPCAPEDCFAVYEWVANHAQALGIDERRIVCCGDSAGGNLAAAVSMMARDRGVAPPCAQVLLYPVLDRRMNTDSMKEFVDTPMCCTGDMEKYYAMYGGGRTAKAPAYLSPMEAQSLAGLPPAYVEVAQYDCLRDEGVDYAKRLREAGSETELHQVEKAMHGYDIAVHSRLVRKCMDNRIAFLKRICGVLD